MDIAPLPITTSDTHATDEIALGAVLLRGIALVWIGYLLTLVGIDAWLLPLVMPAPSFYLVHGTGAVVLLLVAVGAPDWLAREDMRALSIGWIVTVTILAAVPSLAAIGPLDTESLALRSLPVLMFALVLVAWRYQWTAVLIFSVATALLTCAPLLLPTMTPDPPMGPALVVAAIQTTSFLAVGGVVALLLRQVRAQQLALAHANAQLRRFADLREAFGASQERSRIARELHDTLAHTLSGVSIQLESADACWEDDPQQARVRVGQAHAVIRSGLQETRRALRALRASPLAEHGLIAALEQLARSHAVRAGAQLLIKLPSTRLALAAATEQCVYRVAQEALTNIVRHAAATTIWVQLWITDSYVELQIRDDGRGFTVADAIHPEQYGLHGLRERTAVLGGNLQIVSAPSAGTTIHLRVTDTAAD